MTDLHLIAFDTETHRFKAGLLAPPIVCSSFAWVENGEMLLQVRPGRGYILDLLSDVRVRIVGQNVSYDMSCVAADTPDALPTIFQAYEDGRVVDTIIAEKIIQLGTTGNLEFGFWNDRPQKLVYNLPQLAEIYGYADAEWKASKKEIREEFEGLAGVPFYQWPSKYLEYSRVDAEKTLLVYMAQVERAKAEDVDLEATLAFQSAVDFALRLQSCHGFAVDLEMRDKILAQCIAEIEPTEAPLVEAGILRPAVLPKARANGTFTKGKPSTVNQAVLRALVERVSTENELDLKQTPTGKTSFDKEVLENLHGYDPVLDAFQARAYLQKLVTAELPSMTGTVVYPRYDVLKATGRTSSYGDDSGAYASRNIQQISSVRKIKQDDGSVNEINVRHCYVARPGRVLCSSDLGSVEFVAMAQVCWELFGFSVMRDLLLEGVDPHAYLGAELARYFDDNFREACQREGLTDPLQRYKAFKACQSSEDKKVKDFYKKYRTLAKPVGFGFPGGLGARKFVAFAKAQYKVTVTFDEAKALKQIFMSTYPEMGEYFKWVETQDDPVNPGTYTYLTPFGLRRRGAHFTAFCNGRLLQSPAADPEKLAVWEISRACYDRSYGSILYGSNPEAFVHDEVITEIDEGEFMVDRAEEHGRILRVAVESVFRDVPVRVSTVLMRRWDKAAEPVYDASGRLTIWEPSP